MAGNNCRIAVLSGKGGTGKTLVSVNLAAVAGHSVYADCDVEEPNGHLYFKPVYSLSEDICVRMPYADNELCNGCRVCVEFCRFNALAYINGKLKVFEEICHSCGGCALLCPVKAIREKDKSIGKIYKGISGDVAVITGALVPGEASGIPIIKAILRMSEAQSGPLFIDCPPGSACIVMESIREADYCVLVAEPTIFGAHNLRMVYELAGLFGKPCGVVLNKCQEGENPSEKFCIENSIKILGEIPYDERLGEMNSNGQIVVYSSRKYEELFVNLLRKVYMEAGYETAAHT